MDEDAGTAYRQVLEDVDGDVTIKGQDGTYIGFNDRRIGGTVDVWDADVLRIDGRDSDVGEGIVVWNGDAERLDLGNSSSDHVIVRDSSIKRYWGARMETGYVNVKDADIRSVTLAWATVDAIKLDGADAGTVDISGATIGGIEADERSTYNIIVDDDTYVHDVPEELVAELGYRQVTENEHAVLDAVARLGFHVKDPMDAETVAWYVQDVMDAAESPQQVHGTASSLVRKGMLTVEDGQYGFTTRGMHAHTYTSSV